MTVGRSDAGPWLAPEAVAGRVAPLRGWRAAQCDVVADLLDQMQKQWQDDWGLKTNPTGTRTAVSPWAADAGDDEWQRVHGLLAWGFLAPPSPSDMGARAGTASRARRALARSLFGEDRTTANTAAGSGSLAQEAAEAAWADWLAGLGELVPAPVDGSSVDDTTMATVWSGDLQATLPWCGGTWRLRLAGDAVATLLAKQPAARSTNSAASPALGAKNRLTDALATHPMRVQAHLDPVVLTLGQLQTLRPGDVIPLTHPLDQALQLQLEGGTVFAQGWLGRQDDRVALQLATL